MITQSKGDSGPAPACCVKYPYESSMGASLLVVEVHTESEDTRLRTSVGWRTFQMKAASGLLEKGGLKRRC